MKERNKGNIYAIIAFVIWGLLPIYWKALDSVKPTIILANRIFWAFILLVIIITITKKWKILKEKLKDRKLVLLLTASSILIGINWGLYIYAVVTDRILETSLGYYINPLLVVIIGVIFYKEKLDLLTKIAIGVAAIGVIIKTIQYGQIPILSLALATSFALYGGIKKSTNVDSSVGLAIETAILAPFALAYLIYAQPTGNTSPIILLLLIGAGLVTLTPLLFFSSAAKRVPLSVLGFTQYISPTVSLVLGVFVYRESFGMLDLVSFIFIWLALIIYTYSSFKNKKIEVSPT